MYIQFFLNYHVLVKPQFIASLSAYSAYVDLSVHNTIHTYIYFQRGKWPVATFFYTV